MFSEKSDIYRYVHIQTRWGGIYESPREVENSHATIFFPKKQIYVAHFERMALRAQKCVSDHFLRAFGADRGFSFFRVKKGLFLRGFIHKKSDVQLHTLNHWTSSHKRRSLYRRAGTANLYVFGKYLSLTAQKYILVCATV